MIRRICRCAVVICLAVIAALAYSTQQAQAMEKDVVFIKAFYPLDEPRFHCIDIPGHRDRVRTSAALSVHTCKEGIWNLDEHFDPAAVKKGMLRMPEYGLCVAAASAADGAKLMLKKCDGTALQDWRFENYRLSLKAHPEKCITIGPEPSRLTRGGRRLPSRHMARSLALGACSEDALERQLWRLEKPMKRTGSIMPFRKSE
ncbi:MAG: ricin-type beta-trefoil lectin domain protein [Nitrospinae bacterium]|nr:ricin-type beta-trefoil lectin domain protein [Nitrospinota bacterium]